MIKEWLEEYHPKDQKEAEMALREIMQEIALAGLHRGKFFENAAFYGGTALSIFYGSQSLVSCNKDQAGSRHRAAA